MSFLQTELDHAAFLRPADRLACDLARTPPLDETQWDGAGAISPVAPARWAEKIVVSGLPGLIIPLPLLLATAASWAWLFAAGALPLAAWSIRHAAPRRHRLAASLTLLGHAGLALGLIITAANQAAFSITVFADAADSGLGAYLMAPLTILLAFRAWALARRGIAFATRDMLVVEGITLALTLIVLANYTALTGTALGGETIGTFDGAAPIGLIATKVGLASLSPVLSAGIAFCALAAGVSVLKAARRASTAVLQKPVHFG